MPNILNNLPKITKLDQSNLRGSIAELSLQIKQTWSEINKIKLDKKYRQVKNIIMGGMGGSAIGGHIIKSLYKDKIKIPIEIVNSYTLPESISKDSLVIISSYSGGTEEPIASINLALKRKAKILAITSGGKLEKLCQKHNIPYYLIKPKYNPSNQPRMALGYSIFGQIGLLSKCGLIKISSAEVKTIINYLEKLNQKWRPEALVKNNLAKKIALELYNKIPILIASEFLVGNAHTFSNQLNENAKTFANYFVIPELNHHLMEGLSHPKSNSKILQFIFLNSSLYHKKNQKRHQITQKVVKKNGVNFLEYTASGKNKLEQSFEILLLGSYVGFYLAILNNLNPSPIPWVDYFKKELDK